MAAGNSFDFMRLFPISNFSQIGGLFRKAMVQWFYDLGTVKERLGKSLYELVEGYSIAL